MQRLWPDPTPLNDDALLAAYDLDDRTVIGVRVNFVTSTDGAVAVNGLSIGLSSPDDRRIFGLLRMLTDVLLVGAGTLRQENYQPLRLDEARRDWRRSHGLPEYPVLAVVSNQLAISADLRALADAPVRPIVITHAAAPGDRRAALETVADVVNCGETAVDLSAALSALASRGLPQILCEGGPQLLGGLTADDLVDEMCLTMSPLLAGPGAGRITAGPPSPAVRHLALRHVLAGDDGTLFLRYRRAAGEFKLGPGPGGPGRRGPDPM